MYVKKILDKLMMNHHGMKITKMLAGLLLHEIFRFTPSRTRGVL